MKADLGLINRALAKTTGANVHDVRVLGAYYRNACEIAMAAVRTWPAAKRAARLREIDEYARVLEHFATTGQFPRK
jgi:hypothetical protein